MILGIDSSTYFEVLAKHPHFYYRKKEIEPLALLHDQNGASLLRIRLWVDPYDEKGRPYHGGTNDWDAFLRLAKFGMQKGYAIMLDFQYSDFWCDPSKQMMPKSWKGQSLSDLTKTVYDYTKKTLQNCIKERLDISYIQIGNEITNGMLWPLGKLVDNPQGGPRLGYDNLAQLIKAGQRACKETIPSARTMIQLERSGSLKLHEEFFGEVIKRGVDFDAIGLSYYPYWHGTFGMLWANVENLKKKFAKPILIVETGYGFTLESYVKDGNAGANLIDDAFLKDPENSVCAPFPLSFEGQKEFVLQLLSGAKSHSVEGVVYWEPFWLPLPGLEWASKCGEEYIHETNKPTHNEWANQCLFDYDGNATPALDVFKI